jgi:hypothetical protein
MMLPWCSCGMSSPITPRPEVLGGRRSLIEEASMRRLRRALIIGVSLALLSFQLAQATPLLTSKWRNYYWNGHNNTVWYCFSPSFPGGNYQYRAVDAANAWNNVKSELYHVWQNSSCNLELDWVDITFPYPDNWYGRTVVGTCVTPIDRHCIANIYMDYGVNWYTGIGTPSATQLDLRSGVAHEWGHTTAMGHESSNSDYVMYANLSLGQVKYVPKCGEANVLRSGYGSDGTATCRP